MTDKEEKAIERCKQLIKVEQANWIGLSNQDAIETVLNVVERQNKIIDLMAEQLRTPVNSKEWIKEYYKHEVKTKIYTEEEMKRIEKEDMGYDR